MLQSAQSRGSPLRCCALQFIVALMNERPSSSTDRVLFSTELINPAELAVRILLVRKDLAVQVRHEKHPSIVVRSLLRWLLLSVRHLLYLHLLLDDMGL